MKRRTRRSPEAIFLQVLLVVTFLGIISIFKSVHNAPTQSLNSLSKRDPFKTEDQACRLVYNRPDQCSFVQENCPDEEAGLLSYLRLYFCSLPNAKPLAFIILAVWISILFSTIGIAASDFLCLNLSTISTLLGMSESLAGVTFLAFGNGSPDVFSTFAAFSTNSGSLAVGELVGAAGFITAVVAGSMAITKPFRVAKKSFVRDVGLFAIAAGFSMNFLKDGSLRMWECIVMIGFYVSYVIFVVAWHWWFDRRRRIKLAETAARLHQHIPDQQELDAPEYVDDEEGRPAAERTPLIRTASGEASIQSTYNPGTPAWVMEHPDDMDDETRDQYLATLSSNMRISRPTRDRRNTITPIRPSLIGALEFRSVLSALEKKSTHPQPIYMRRYSDEGRSTLAEVAEAQAAISQPELLSDVAQQNYASRPPSSTNGRTRAVSANDATALGINRSFLDLPTGTPDTAIYTPDLHPSDNNDSGLRPQPQVQNSQNLLLTPRSASSVASTSGTATPASMAATKNGFLAPPEPGSSRPSSAVSPGAISPLALTPRVLIPDLSKKSSQDWRYTDSPLVMSSVHSRPPSIHLPPPSMSPESSHVLILPDDEPLLKHQIKWWPYKYLPSPEAISSTLFPGFCDWSTKSWFGRILAVCTAPSIFLLTITVPVVEDKGDNDDDADYLTHPILTPIPGSPLVSRTPATVRVPTQTSSSRDRAYSDATVPQITTTDVETVGAPVPKGWNRWLAAVQTFTAPLFTVLILYANIESEGDTKLLVKMILGSLVFSLMAFALLIVLTSPDREPKHKPALCFMGFFVAIAWISTIASEVVGVLKAFGVILDISDAILGLTIFAVGNSLGDLVADITVARLGYPMMALSACFGGPMLNILLGIGIGGLYQTLKNAQHRLRKHPDQPVRYKPYELDISTTLLVSGATLLITLLFLLVVVPLNKWRMDRKVGIGLITIWSVSTVLNVVFEIVGIGQEEWVF